MNNELRINEALLIAGNAFQPFQCVAWAAQDGYGELSLSVIDRTFGRVLGRTRLASQNYRNPQSLAKALQQSRQDLAEQGYHLEPMEHAGLTEPSAGHKKGDLWVAFFIGEHLSSRRFPCCCGRSRRAHP